MSYSKEIPRYTIDLNRPEDLRWKHVAEKELPAIKKLLREAGKNFQSVPGFFMSTFGYLYEVYGGLYADEINFFADALDLGFGEAAMLQCSYEFGQAQYVLDTWPQLKIFGCTAGVKYFPGTGPVHVRNLDWPLKNIANTTSVFEFRKGKRKFIAAGIAGMVGVLSGMLPGKYSVTMNWANPESFPSIGKIGPAFLLRYVLENCDTYEEALKVLKSEPVAPSVFFMLCGTTRDRACVIERTSDKHSVIPIQGDVLTLCNHYRSSKFEYLNEDDPENLSWSLERRNVLEKELLKVSREDINGMAKTISKYPVCNSESFQKMLFCPKTGDYMVWKKKI